MAEKETVTEEEIAALLQRALKDESMQWRDIEVVLERWPRLTIVLRGAPYAGTITTETARALVALQDAVDRAYLRFVRPGGRLSAAERARLTLVARVDNGSTLLTVDLSGALQTFGQQLAGKMTTAEVITTVLALGFMATAGFVIKNYLHDKITADAAVRTRVAELDAQKASRAAELEAQVRQSAEETRRAAILANAVQARPALAKSEADFDVARDALLQSAANADTMALAGIELTGAQADVLRRNPRERARDVQLNNSYQIGAIRWAPDGKTVRFELRATRSTPEFVATMNVQDVAQRDRDLLNGAGWHQAPVYLQINARELRGRITAATVVGFDWERVRELAGGSPASTGGAGAA